MRQSVLIDFIENEIKQTKFNIDRFRNSDHNFYDKTWCEGYLEGLLTVINKIYDVDNKPERIIIK